MENNAPNTNNFLNWVEIKNFKSIKDLRLDCKRVNVFIGKPNVGKSNILEGLGLLGGSYDDSKYLNGAVRYYELKDLFKDIDTSHKIEVSSERISCALNIESPLQGSHEDMFSLLWKHGPFFQRDFHLNSKGKLMGAGAGVFDSEDNNDINSDYDKYRTSPVRKYDFGNLTDFRSTFNSYLLPPYGWNLFSVIDKREDLKNEFAALFSDQNLEFILSRGDQTFVLQKREGKYVDQFPFASIADTFRRFMFYITAIESNKNSVIVFEEPEVHSFPPYTQEMAYRMIYDEDNQYFISTHSPYMLHPFIEKMDYKDLNVFITYYKDYQTHVRVLTEDELTDILDYSTNVFFNLRKFEPNA
ncbi:ATP/GTP-binding protein [Spirosoma flavus]